MAFKLTYSDGQESDYDDDTVWEVDDGVLKLGKEEGKWSVLLSPSHWAVIELGGKSKGKTKSGDGDDSDDDGDDDGDDSDDDDKGEKSKKDDSQKDDDKDDDKDD